jgi:hypothetical protein
MSLQNVQVEFAELLVANEQSSELVHPAVNMLIYHNNLLSHLVNALNNTYPLIVKLVGEAAFKAAARHYIERYPSTSGNLDEYGEYFSDFIADFEPATDLPYLADVARFEWAAHLLARAADAAAFDPARLQQLTENDYATLHAVLHPACHLMQVQYPIPAIIDLCKGNLNEIDSLTPEKMHLLLSRRQHDIIVTTLTPAEFLFLEKSQHGNMLSDCLQSAINLDPSFVLAEKLVNWVKNQIIIDFNSST